MIRFMIPVAALSFLPLCITFAQEGIDSANVPAKGSVTIQTEPEGARVILDADSIGTTPLTVELAPGWHHLRLIPPDVKNWLTDPVVDSVEIRAGESASLQYEMAQRVFVLSTPSGAEVLSGDSLLGTTPLIVKAGTSPLLLRKAGFEDLALQTHNSQRGVVSAQLKKVWQTEESEAVFDDADANGSSLRLYISGAATILAGAASAYFKVKADNTYAEYLRSGNPGQLSEVNRLDTAAGAALVATQIGLGLFTYFILSE